MKPGVSGLPNSRIQSRLFERPFKPHPLLPTGHLQTIVSSQVTRKFPWGWKESEHSLLELEDGSVLRLQCVCQPTPAPTLVAVHGMAGSSRSAYMQAFSHKAFRCGWNALLLNLYDTRPDHRRPRIIHSGSSDKLAEIVNKLAQRPEVDSLLLVGVSLGGNILLKMLGEWEAKHPESVRAAAVISPLCDLTISWQLFEAPSNLIYRTHFLGGLKRLISRNANYLSRFVNVDAVMKVKNIREFDETFTAPLAGFESAMDYYRQASSAPLLGRIQVPTLLIHSKDDPLLPWRPLASSDVVGNPHLSLHLTSRGGHVGFIERKRLDIDRSWAENRVMDFFGFTVASFGGSLLSHSRVPQPT